MPRRFGFVIGIVLVLVALAAGGLGYNMGVSHALVMTAPAAGQPGSAPMVMPYMWYHPWGFGFGFGPLLWLVLIVFLFRGIFWGGMYRHRRYWMNGYGAPPQFEEWHRRAHERMAGAPPDASSPSRG
jgi:hypothetical protein